MTSNQLSEAIVRIMNKVMPRNVQSHRQKTRKKISENVLIVGAAVTRHESLLLRRGFIYDYMKIEAGHKGHIVVAHSTNKRIVVKMHKPVSRIPI